MGRCKGLLILPGCVVLAAAIGWARRARREPSACPFSQRIFLDLPRPFLRREALCQLLAPAPGERILEVGPGTGYYSLDVARRLQPGGRLDVVDLQQPMLDELMARAARLGIATIVPLRDDAQALPYPDGNFDAAFLVATLGEMPDRARALRELRRILKPGGRLVVGEGQPDPHMVRRETLIADAARARLQFVRGEGGPLGYLARFRPSL